MKKIFLILFLILNLNLFASVKLINHTKEVNNADVVYLELIGKNLVNPKLSFENYHLNFTKNDFKKDSYIALIPISYYEKKGTKKIIISYIEKGKKHFKSTNFKIKTANFKTESISVAPSKIDLNEEDKKRTTLEYQEAMTVYKTKTSAILWKSDFTLPMTSKVTSDFGTKRVYNDKFKSFHSGIDFKADIGTAIYAVNDGMVKIAKDRFYAGNSIIINHGLGVYSCYFHLNQILVKKNQNVKKGDLIGYSGSTGRVTGPHLHFAMRVDGVLVEPTKFITLLNRIKE